MECAGFFRRQHPPESDSSKISPNKEGKASTDVNLGDTVNDLLLLFNEFNGLDEAEKEIEKKYVIKPQEHNCWPEDDIKQAWKETKTMGKKTDRKKQWARVIVLQVVRRFFCDICKQNTEQKNHHEPGYEATPDSEDRSSQSKAELETVGAAGGVGKHSGAHLEVSKLTEESGAASGTQLLASSKDVDSSSAEVNSSSSERKGSSKDRSAQTSAKTQTVELGVGVKRRYGESAASESEETSIKHKADDTTCIRIPLTKLLSNKSSSIPPKAGTKLNSKYKLIDGPPEEITKKKTDNNVIKNKQCYVMSYNNEKKNAEWVYEIMNRSTLPSHYKTPQFQDSGSDSDSDDPSYQAPNSSNAFSNTDYDRGHLAAVANHMWCQEAYKDTYWMSNITPQNKNLNKGTWKSLENQCRDIVKDDNVRNVHVYTGPLYMRKELKKDNVDVLNISEMKYVGRKAVPTHYFKVVIVEHNNGTVEEPECILIANEAKQHWEQMDIKSIERISGLKFTEDSPELAEVDHTRTVKWEGNKRRKSVTIAVRISSLKKNDAEPHSLNEE